MTILRVQCNIPRDNAIPADDAINVWHFLTVGAATPAAAASAAVTQLGVFYAAIDALWASYVNTPMRFKVYDLQHVEPRVPILQTTLTVTPGGGGLPGEVAVVLSYNAEPISGVNPARRRGRIFLGPLSETATGALTSSDLTVSSTARTTIANAASDLIVAGATGDARWVVFSPTLAGAPPWSEAVLESSSADVFGGFIDNAYDTIRSRGFTATARTVFSEVLP